MISLNQRLHFASLRIEQSVRVRGDRVSEFDAILQELKEIADTAVQNKNYEILGKQAQVAKRLGVRMMSYATSCPDQIVDFLENFAVEYEDIKDLLVAVSDWENPSKKEMIIEALVDNIIRTEQCYSRKAGCLIEDLIKHTAQSDPVINLCSAVAKMNSSDQSGASQVLNALSASDRHSEKSAMLNEISHWLRRQEKSLANSIIEGEVSQWVNAHAVPIAEQMGLPIMAASLLMRQESFAFEELSSLARAGVYTDDKHLAGVLQANGKNAIERGAVVAYCILFKDKLPESALDGDIVKTLLGTAECLGDEPSICDRGLQLLGEMVRRIKPQDDISSLMRSSIHKKLISFRKYRGMMLENDLGM